MAAPRWLDDTESRAWRGHLRMTWLLNAAIERDLFRQAGLSHADYYVLARLSEVEAGRLRMSELAEGILWSKSRLSHQVARMEARDLVRREGCTGDARGTFCVLTEVGRQAIEEAAPEHVESVRKHLFDVLTSDQVEALAGITDAVVDHLGGAGPADGCRVEEPSARKTARREQG